ncbi:hypothetical protein NQ317_001871 [Molorchus minor]|uniref:Uncharacterized protein n=1 Tax=Molorchus minor TaxID=1323400 RepID=A0ABQ9JZ38_9CUCU|nr:hypothetical protein NQ317_001871 [Molorchus minor]
MPFNVMLQLCKITRSSKLFQRNFYLPLLKPLSPRDALRVHFITGKNVLSKMEHYIPVLEDHKARISRRRYERRGNGKKRQRKSESARYVSPFFDDDMEGHSRLKSLLARKSRGRGQCYTYRVSDKKCTLVIPHQMERAIRDKDIIDITIAQRSEKIVVFLKDMTKVTVPLAPYNGNAPFYRGEGWTNAVIEEGHHHGRETWNVVRLFEALESGVEEWELEMMRMAAKKKKRHVGEGTADWKAMINTTVENMDWEEFEEEAKQIVEEANEPVDDEPISMEVDDMEKTKNVNEKLKNAGEDLLSKLPVMPEIPEIINTIKAHGDLTEIANVSGVTLTLQSTAKERFVPGQMVKSAEGELFVPGQTIVTETGRLEYTPGFTVLLNNEPTLIPGLVMGNDPDKAMFLPGDSSITEGGELQFTETEDDFRLEPEEEEAELEEDQNTDDEEDEMRPPPPPRKRQEYHYEKPPKLAKNKQIDLGSVDLASKFKVPIFYDFTSAVGWEDLLLEGKQRVSDFTEKKAKEEVSIDKRRREIRLMASRIFQNRPIRRDYVPLGPAKKSDKLKELENLIKSGSFFDIDYKKYLILAEYGGRATSGQRQINGDSPPAILISVIGPGHRCNQSESIRIVNLYPHSSASSSLSLLSSIRVLVQEFTEMPINVKISLCKITRASKLFQRNYYLPLLKPLSPKDALRRKIITGQNVLGNRVEHYIPVLKPHDEKAAERKRRGKGVPVVKKRIRKSENTRYVEPFIDENMENHPILQSILNRKSRGKGQHYVYEVFDKKCVLVIGPQMEQALKDREVIDIIIAQRSEKIVAKLADGTRVTLPLAPYEGNAPLYRGSGWTKEHIEQEHHHGKETMSIAKLFEAKESGVEDWELEMMRLANKRKKKCCLENMDWDKFEEETKQIVEEKEEVVEEENIPMEVNNMEKTTNVAEKLKQGGEEVLSQLPIMTEIPEVIRVLETGDMCELQNVSGVKVKMSDGKMCFVTGQMVTTDENEVFVPGQTILNEEGQSEYTPGITVYMDNEPTLIPGLVMGEEDTSAMFFARRLDDYRRRAGDERCVPHQFCPQTLRNTDRNDVPSLPVPPPPPKPKSRPKVEEEIVIRRRVIEEPSSQPTRKERVRKKLPIEVKSHIEERDSPPKDSFRPQRQPMDDPLKLYQERRQKEEDDNKQKQKDKTKEKLLKAESQVDQLRLNMRKKMRGKLAEMERSIKKGTFFEDEKTKEILERAKSVTRMLKYQHILQPYNNDFGRRF